MERKFKQGIKMGKRICKLVDDVLWAVVDFYFNLHKPIKYKMEVKLFH